MRVVSAIVGAAALTAAGMVGVTAPANASNWGFELNGTYAVLSNGEWAKSNQAFKPEAVVRSTWQITSSCTSPYACTGQVISDQGWTEPLKFNTDRWLLNHEIPNWAVCGPGDNGPNATGHQLFVFYGTDDNGQNSRSTDLLAGKDITNTDSGSCGRNLPLFIEIPLRLNRIS